MESLTSSPFYLTNTSIEWHQRTWSMKTITPLTSGLDHAYVTSSYMPYMAVNCRWFGLSDCHCSYQVTSSPTQFSAAASLGVHSLDFCDAFSLMDTIIDHITDLLITQNSHSINETNQKPIQSCGHTRANNLATCKYVLDNLFHQHLAPIIFGRINHCLTEWGGIKEALSWICPLMMAFLFSMVFLMIAFFY